MGTSAAKQNTVNANNQQFDKYLKNIKSAGQWARMLGWVILATSPFLFWAKDLIQDYSFIFYYLLLVVPLALYLLYTGKYIQYGGGKYIPKFLILNSLIALIFVSGIIPIFLFFTSVVAYFNYRQLKKSNELKLIKKDKYKLSLTELIIVAGIILFGSGIIILNATNTANLPTAENLAVGDSSFYDSQAKEYVSAEHGFRIKFPGFPSVERESLHTNGYDVPYITYDTSRGAVSYMVVIYDYRAVQGEYDEIGGLEGAINGFAQAYKGGRILNSSLTTLYGYNAKIATVNVPYEGTVYTAYLTAIIKDKVMYTILTLGVDQPTYDKFSGTFSFTR